MYSRNKKYFNLGSDTEQPYVTWDISDGDEIVFPDLMTMGKLGDTKETLLAEIQKCWIVTRRTYNGSNNFKQDTDIKTANNFYQVEAHNLSPYSSSVLTLNTAKTINVTFANAGNCQGVVLTFTNLYSSGVTTGITVKLKESGTERASVTLTADDITNNSGSYFGYWVTPFEFPTPYAIDTTPGKWTFEVSQTAMLSPWWYLQTSNGSSAMFATWCDNLTSFSANDTVICKDIVTISDDTQVRGTLSTGDSSNAIALLVCKSKGTPPTKTNNQVNLQIQPSSAPTTLTIDGLICWGAHGGWQVGTSTTPVPAKSRRLLT